MSNEAFAQGFCSVWFAETFIENGVPNAAQSSCGTAKVASAVEVGITAEAEVEGGTNEADVGGAAEAESERGKNGADVGGRGIDDGLLNKMRGLTVSKPFQKKKIPLNIFLRQKSEELIDIPPRLSSFSYCRAQDSSYHPDYHNQHSNCQT